MRLRRHDRDVDAMIDRLQRPTFRAFSPLVWLACALQLDWGHSFLVEAGMGRRFTKTGFLTAAILALALGCGDACNDSSGGGGNGDGDGTNAATNNGDNGPFTDGEGRVCAEATPCGDCDQDCRPAGNPFAPGGGSGGDPIGTAGDGEACGGDFDCAGGVCEGGVCVGDGNGAGGDVCTQDGDCAGSSCEGGTCVGDGSGIGGEQCTQDGDCAGASSCSAGTCEGGGSGMGGTGDPGTGGGGDGIDYNQCADLQVHLQHAIPTVALLIDQSGSMDTDFGNGMNRLEAAYNALMDPVDGIIQELQGAFRIGFSLYTSYSQGDTCPELADVRPELNNYDPIDRVFAMAEPAGDTPTGESIQGILRMFDIHPDQGRKIILLATDGEPDTCAVPNPQNGQPEAIAAAQEAYDQDIETFVLSVGDEVGAPHLQDVANAGAGLQVGGAQNAPYFEANDPAALKNEMKSIIEGTRSCIFRVLGGVVDPGLVDRGTVTLDGEVLPFQGPNGFTYHQDRKTCQGAKQCIELLGDACEKIQDGDDHMVDGDFICVYHDPDGDPGFGFDPDDGGDGGGSGGDNNGMGGGGGGPGPCIPNNTAGCAYDGDCCSGLCGSGTCIAQ